MKARREVRAKFERLLTLMYKIANTDELQTELRLILAYSQSELPSRVRLAHDLLELSRRMTGASAKAFFGHVDGFNWAFKVEGVDSDFPNQPLGRQQDGWEIIKKFKASAKSTHVSAKSRDGKKSMTEMKRWVKDENPSQFFAKWKETSEYKDDSVEVFYK